MTTLLIFYAAMMTVDVLAKLFFLSGHRILVASRGKLALDVLVGVVFVVCTAFVVARGY